MELQGTAAIVTGGTGGLGRRICRALSGSGAGVVVGYTRRQQQAETVVRELREAGGRAIAVSADVSNQGEVRQLVAAAEREFGRLDILVNDAAYNKWIPFPKLEELPLEEWTKILSVNLTGPFLCIQAAAPAMRRHGQGRIVNISSIAGLSPMGSSIAYAVSKAGLIHLTRCLAVALAPDILVNSVAPGFMEGTRMSENLAPEYQQRARQSALLQRAVDKDDVARLVLDFCATDSITGQTLVLDAGRVFH